MRPLLVGEAPSRPGPCDPLTGRVGRRIAGLAGLTLAEYCATFDRTNLLPFTGGRFPLGDAVTRAGWLLIHERQHRRPVVLLGANVRRAFRIADDVPLLTWRTIPPQLEFALCPHPSGRCRWWNDAANAAQAAVFFSDLARRTRAAVGDAPATSRMP